MTRGLLRRLDEAAETAIFLTEARQDYTQGINIPRDDPSDGRAADGYSGCKRYACKMATGSGKTTVMGMLAAWSTLNKVNDRSDARFSDVVLVVCPNVTMLDRLRELNPGLGESSIYRTRDLVPDQLMSALSRGKVLVTNWHVFEPQGVKVGGEISRVSKAGVAVTGAEWIRIGPKTTTARGRKYLTQEEFDRQVAAGLMRVIGEDRNPKTGDLKRVRVEATLYVESDTAMVNRLLDREVGGKQNILVFNDEAHHAYRIRKDEPEQTALEEEALRTRVTEMLRVPVHVGDFLRVGLDERLARFDLVAKQDGEHLVGLDGVLDRYLRDGARFQVHGGLGQVLGVHLAKTLEPRDRARLSCVAQALRISSRSSSFLA